MCRRLGWALPSAILGAQPALAAQEWPEVAVLCLIHSSRPGTVTPPSFPEESVLTSG